MRALVTGGAGFIGSHLVDGLLASGSTVLVADDLSTGSLENLLPAIGSGGPVTFRMVGLLSEAFEDEVAAFEPDVIFHLAAQSSVAVSTVSPLVDAETNILGTLRVLETARRVGARKVVFAASGGTLYGELEVSEPPDEMAPRRPASPYGISKQAGLSYLEYYGSEGRIETTALALANVFGPRQNPTGEAGVVAIFAHRAIAGDELVIYGDGRQTRDFVHVHDVVDAFLRAARPGAPGLYNIGSGVETSVRDIARAVLAEVDTPSRIVYRPARPGEVRRSVLDASLARRELGWEPTIALGEGIRDLIEECYGRGAPTRRPDGDDRVPARAGSGE